MLKRHWHWIVCMIAIFGGLAIAYTYQRIADETKPSMGSYDAYQPSRDASAPKRREAGELKPTFYDPHCLIPQNQSDADLCAQWSAVKSVSEGNRLVRISSLIALVTGALSIIATMIGTILVYKSLQHSEEGIAAAVQANNIAQETAKRELRAYVGVTNFEIIEQDDGFPLFKVLYKNGGQTPARDCISLATIAILSGVDRNYAEDIPDGPLLSKLASSSILPGDFNNDVVKFRVTVEKFGDLLADGDVVFLYGWIRYIDIFGEQHETKFRAFVDAMSIGVRYGLSIAPYGNSST